jgi:hypothetical protein
MIDPATSWFENKEVQNREAQTVASVVEQTWLTRYRWPTIVVFDKGTDFMGDFARMVAKDYGIERKGISVRNTHAHAIIERIHQTIGNIIRTFEIQNSDDLDKNDHGRDFCQQRCLLSEQLSLPLSKPHQRNWYLEEMQL